jgi:hypothetical protein
MIVYINDQTGTTHKFDAKSVVIDTGSDNKKTILISDHPKTNSIRILRISNPTYIEKRDIIFDITIPK